MSFIDNFTSPIWVASGTFGYAQEMDGVVDLSRLGAIIPKTVTLAPRPGNAPPRTVETAAGMLNSIGLDNDGIDEFLTQKVPYLQTLKTKIIISIAVKNIDECSVLGEKVSEFSNALSFISHKGTKDTKKESKESLCPSCLCENQIAAIELNVSCPNVSGGVDFATDPKLCEQIVQKMRQSLTLPLIVKLSPNVWNIGEVAKGAEAGGADAVSAVNTCLGLAVDWRKRKPRLGNGFGGLSGPAIKPIALRCVRHVYRAVKIPVIGIGGIETIDDVMEFLVTGASAVQIGTANFYKPTATMRILDALPDALAELGAKTTAEIVGTLQHGD
jgi:dihydroorotate dehydrogenase (NAD+) catalytic subunit